MLIKKQKDPSRHAGGSIDDLSRELNYKLVCFVKFFTLMYIHQAKDVYTHMHKHIQRYLRLRKIFIYLTIYALQQMTGKCNVSTRSFWKEFIKKHALTSCCDTRGSGAIGNTPSPAQFFFFKGPMFSGTPVPSCLRISKQRGLWVSWTFVLCLVSR